MLRSVARAEEACFKGLLDAHRYLGAVAKIGHTLWYVATWREQWLALLVVSAAAWKCAARDRWIGWDQRCQYDRLHLIANNARFLILPDPRRGPGAAPSVARSPGDGRRRGAVRGARLQGHRRVGRGSQPAGAGTLSLPLPQRPLRGPQPHRLPRSAHSVSHPRTSIALCRGGTRRWPAPTKASPSMARPCATPSTSRGVKPTSSVQSGTKVRPATPKKVTALPVGATDEVKQTNEIGMAIPLLESLDIAGKTITADALLTQRKIAEHVVAREARCRLRTGHGPENITRLRRFAVGLIKANSDDSVAATIAKLARRTCRVLDYFLMTDNRRIRIRIGNPSHPARQAGPEARG